MKKTLLTTLLMLFIALSAVYASESFVLGTYNPQIDVCAGEIFDDTLVIYNNGNYLSEYQVGITSKEYSNWVKLSINSFSMVPGSKQGIDVKFKFPSTYVGKTLNVDVGVLTALSNKKTLTYTINVKECPLPEFVTIVDKVEAKACYDKVVNMNLTNPKTTDLTYRVKYKFLDEIYSFNETVEEEYTQEKSITLDIPCGADGEQNLDMIFAPGQMIRTKRVVVDIVPYTFHTLSIDSDYYTICGATDFDVTMDLSNQFTKTLDYTLDVDGPGYVKFSDDDVEIKSRDSKEVILDVSPTFMPKEKQIVVLQFTDERGALLEKNITLDYMTKKECETPLISTENASDITINDESEIEIELENIAPDYYVGAKEEVTYNFKIEPEQSWITLSQDELTIGAGDDDDVDLILLPKNSTIGRTYKIDVIVESDLSKSRISYDIVVPKHTGQKFFTKDNLGYLWHTFSPFLIVGLILGIVLILLLILFLPESGSNKEYNVVKKKKEKKEVRTHGIEEIKSNETKKVIPTRDDVDKINTDKELKSLLATIEIEKKARERIIDDLKEWSGQYESLQKDQSKKERMKIKSKEKLAKEYKDINDLLTTQKDNYSKLEIREKQVKDKINKKHGFFAGVVDFFKGDDKYVDVDDVKRKQDKINAKRKAKEEKQKAKEEKKQAKLKEKEEKTEVVEMPMTPIKKSAKKKVAKKIPAKKVAKKTAKKTPTKTRSSKATKKTDVSTRNEKNIKKIQKKKKQEKSIGSKIKKFFVEE